jgi:hypothetical protein
VHGAIRAGLGVAVAVAIASCAAVQTLGQVPTVSIAPGLAPRLSAVDATRITVDYLDAQRSELAAPELHQDPVITSVTAVRADDAPAIDGGAVRLIGRAGPTRRPPGATRRSGSRAGSAAASPGS